MRRNRRRAEAEVFITPEMLMEGTLRLFNSPHFDGSLRAAEGLVSEVFGRMIEVDCSTRPAAAGLAENCDERGLTSS